MELWKNETFNLLIPNLYGGVSKSFLEDKKESEIYKSLTSIQRKKQNEFEKQFNDWSKNF